MPGQWCQTNVKVERSFRTSGGISAFGACSVTLGHERAARGLAGHRRHHVSASDDSTVGERGLRRRLLSPTNVSASPVLGRFCWSGGYRATAMPASAATSGGAFGDGPCEPVGVLVRLEGLGRHQLPEIKFKANQRRCARIATITSADCSRSTPISRLPAAPPSVFSSARSMRSDQLPLPQPRRTQSPG